MQAVVEGKHKSSDISLTNFTHETWRGYKHTRYQALIDEHLEQVARYIETGGAEGIGRLMIFLPPRHGKTNKIRHFCGWLLGRNPHLRLIMTSYGMALAQRNSRYVRNLIASSKYQEIFPQTKLSRDTKAATEWDIADYGGGAIAAGVGGAITGHGANLIIIDDPVKNRAQAESETYRQGTKDWYTNDVITRLEEPGGAMIVIQTRWHQDDLSGWLLEQHEDAEEWVVLILPALADDDDLLGREPGEALWPERYPAEWLEKRQRSMGDYAFASLYQQRPIPSGGGLFDTSLIQIIEKHEVPDLLHIVRFYDLAITTKKRSDYTAGVKLGVTADQRWVILHVWRVKKEMPDVERGIIANAQLDGTKVRIRLEADKSGIVGLQHLLRDPRMSPFTIDAKPPDGDKYTRAGPFATRVNNGRVLMVRGNWNQAYLDEFSLFPASTKDDQVDATSGAYDLLVWLIRVVMDKPIDLAGMFGDIL